MWSAQFFVLSVVFGAYFLSNLTIAILKAKFDSAVAQILEELQNEEAIIDHEVEAHRQAISEEVETDGAHDAPEDGETSSPSSTGKQKALNARKKVKAINALKTLQEVMDKREGERSTASTGKELEQFKESRGMISSVMLLSKGSDAATKQSNLEKAKKKATRKRQQTMRMLGQRGEASVQAQGMAFGGVIAEEEPSNPVRPTPSGRKSPLDEAIDAVYSCHKMFRRITESKPFEYFFIFLVVFNTILLMLEFHDQPLWWAQILEVGNYACAIIFALEMTMRLSAEGCSYFKQAFNVFDSFIVITSLLDLYILGSSKVGFSAARSFRILRLFRVLRVFRVLRFLDKLKNIILIVLRCVPHVTWVVIMLFTIMSLYAEIGVVLFRGKFDFAHGKPRAHFDNFFYAFVTMFQVLTLDDWEFVMFDAIESVGGWEQEPWQSSFVAMFFVSWIVIGVWLLLNVLTILILSRFSKEAPSVEEREEQARKVLMDTLAMVRAASPTI